MKKLLSALALISGLALAPQAQAALIIDVAGGADECTSPTNTSCIFSTLLTGTQINGFDVTVIAYGIDSFFGNGVIFDIGSIELSTTGSGSLEIVVTQTNLQGTGLTTFSGEFTNPMLTGLTAVREFYLDSTNSGGLTSLMGSTANGQNFTYTGTLAGQYSVSERIFVTATARGGILSSDDQLRVPEPGTLALLGIGLAGLGFARRRKQ